MPVQHQQRMPQTFRFKNSYVLNADFMLKITSVAHNLLYDNYNMLNLLVFPRFILQKYKKKQ